MRADCGASCGGCGQDFMFGTPKERNDWLCEHDRGHDDFVSFFRQAAADGGSAVSTEAGGGIPTEQVAGRKR